MNSQDAMIWVDPGRCGGSPCITGTRIDTRLAARAMWTSGADEALSSWPHLEVSQLRAACWFEVRHGKKKWRNRWGAWADQFAMQIWQGKWDEVPDPPMRAEP